MNKKFLSGSTLKWIAIITMLIDHIGAVIIPHVYSKGIAVRWVNWEIVYQVFRTIGRLSFPLFCFLLVEGYRHTSNKWKYLGRLIVFAFVSEVCFDWAIYGEYIYKGSQNIFFELALGVLLMIGTDFFEKKLKNIYLHGASSVAIWFAGMLIARLFELDYGMYGILSIGILYLLRNVPNLQLLGGALSFCWELPAPLGFVFAYFYNGERGKQRKYFFYIFYPIHLALLWLISRLISSV